MADVIPALAGALSGSGQPLPPRVSVIIIFLDALPFLNEAIDSVLCQSCADWELVLIDDGSSDGSTALAMDYCTAHPQRIRYFDHAGHANLGMSASRNLGLEKSRSAYVTFLDGDDVYLPERLERHASILDAFPQVDMVQSDLIMWYSWQAPAERECDDQVRPFLAQDDRVLEPPHGLLTILTIPFFSVGICNITVRRQAALEVGGFDPRFRNAYEDQVFISKIYLEKNVYVRQEYLARYRRHPASWMQRMKASGQVVHGMTNASTRAFQHWLKNYVQERGVQHPLLDEVLAAMTAKAPLPARLARRIGGPAVAGARRLLAQVLPRSGYRRLLQWNWQREATKALREYRRLCRRMDELASGRGVREKQRA